MRQNELEDLQHGLEPTPGPGSYTGIYSNSSFKGREIAKKYQRMGIASDRW
jgi:hypothetical protein